MSDPRIDAYWQPDRPLCAGCWHEMPDDADTSVCPDCVLESEEEFFNAVSPYERLRDEADFRWAA